MEATEQHIPAMAGFFHQAWREAEPGAPGWAGADEELIGELTRPDSLRERIGGPIHRMFLAIENDRVVAFAGTRWEGDAPAVLAGIAVLKAMVGRGIGTSLLEAALQRLELDGANELAVRTEADNERALGFYRANEFEDGKVTLDDVNGVAVVIAELHRSIGAPDSD